MRFKPAVPGLSATTVAGADLRRDAGAGTPRAVEHTGQAVEAVRDLLRAGREAQTARVSANVIGE